MTDDDLRETPEMHAAGVSVRHMIDGDKTTHYVWRGGLPVQSHATSDAAYADAQAKAEAILEARELTRQQGRASLDRAGDARRAHDRLAALAAEVSSRHPDADPAEFRDGAFYWRDHRFGDAVALETHILIRKRAADRQRAYEAGLDQAILDYDATIRLSLSEKVDQRRNRTAAWGDQEVDLMVPPTHPSFPTTGTVELVDGRAVIDTLTRDELALSLGVPFPETIDERAERNRVLGEVREAARQRAEDAAAKAREAASDAEKAEKAALAMHHATL